MLGIIELYHFTNPQNYEEHRSLDSGGILRLPFNHGIICFGQLDRCRLVEAGIFSFLPMCFFFVGNVTFGMHRELRDLRKRLADLEQKKSS